MLEVLLAVGTLLGIPAFGLQIYGWYVGNRLDAQKEANALDNYPDTSSDNTLVLDEDISATLNGVVLDTQSQQPIHSETSKFIASMLHGLDSDDFSFVTSKEQIVNLLESESDVYFSEQFNSSPEAFFAGETEDLVIVELVWFDQDEDFVFLVSPLETDLM